MCDIQDSILMSDCNIKCKIKIRNSIIAYNSSITSNLENTDEKILILGEGTKIVI